MKKKNVVRGITLGLILGTSLISAVAYANTPITNGTHSVGGDNVLNNNYVNVASGANVVINVTDDTKLTQTANGGFIYNIGNGANNTSILVNGNNKDIISDGNGRIAYMGDGSTNNSIILTNVKSLTVDNSTYSAGNQINLYGSNNSLSIAVNNDMNFNNNAPKNPCITSQDSAGNNISIDLQAGHNMNFSGINNLIYVKYNSTINATAGNDIVLTGLSPGNPAIILQYGAVGNFTAKHDFIVDTPSNPIQVKYAAQGKFIAGNDINITSSGTGGGIAISTADTETFFEAQNGSFTMQSTGGNTASIFVQTGAKAKIMAAKDVVVGGNAQRGLRATTGGQFDITAGDGYTIDISATNTSAGNNAGIYTEGTDSIVNLYSPTNITAVTNGIDANNGKVNFAKEAVVSGAETGVNARNSGTVAFAGSTKITSKTTGVEANNATVTFDKDTVITGAATGVNAHDSGTAAFHGPTHIAATTTGVEANNATVTFDKDAVISGAATGISAQANGTVTLDQALSISGGETAVDARSGGKVRSLKPSADKRLTGNILSDGAGSEVDLVLSTPGSYFTGFSARTGSGSISLELANTAPWNVTADSSVSNLINNSTVNMRYTGNAVNETLTTDNLSGNGNFIINTDLQSSYDSRDVTQNGDKIVITTSSNGNHILDLRDVSLDEKLASEGYLLLVEDQSNGAATFSGKDLEHGGIFKYRPVIVTDNPTDYSGFNAAAKNWYLTGFEKLIEVSDNTKETMALSDTRYANYLMDNDTLLKRLGELRMLKAEEDNDGLWARYRHGSMSGERFDGSFTTFQLGYDKKTSKKRYTGAAYSHTSNSFDLNAGKGEGSMDALSLYNTWLGDKGHYFDIVGRIGRMRGDSNYVHAWYPERGEYESRFYSLSGEYGKKTVKDNGYYYEPQAQLTLGRITGDDYTTSRGTRVAQKSITSLIGRAGITVGREYNRDNPAKHSNVYGKINYLHEFKGDGGTSLTDMYGQSFGQTTGFGGSWWNLGLGTTVNLNKETHLYIDLEKNFGGEIKTNWLMQAGVRWTW